MAYIPGAGIKKPLNMLESPIYPDIKQAPPEFKWSKKYWVVDTGQTILDSETTGLPQSDAVLAKSYRDNIDKYGQDTYQEKITVFRPPLQTAYEDFGPLNRLPTKVHKIIPRINPETASDSGGTVAYQTNNMVKQDVDSYIIHESPKHISMWRSTYWMPIENPIDNSVLPDLVMTIPEHSANSGFFTNYTVNTPLTTGEEKIIEKPKTSMHAGHANNYSSSFYNQTSTDFEFENNMPIAPIHTGHASNLTRDGEVHYDERQLHRNIPERSTNAGINTNININAETNLDQLELNNVIPITSVSSGYNTKNTVNGQTRFDEIELERRYPTSPISSGYNAISMIDGETHLDEMRFDSHLTSRLDVVNPVSEIGYQTRIDGNGNNLTSADNYIKMRKNTHVATTAYSSFDYKDNKNVQSVNHHVRTKIQPIKTYNTPLNAGTIRTKGVEQPPIGGRFFQNKRAIVK